MPVLRETNAFALLGQWSLLEIVQRLSSAGEQGCSGPELKSLFSNLDSRELTGWMKQLANAGLVRGEVRGRFVHYFIVPGVIDALVATLRSDSILYLERQRHAQRAAEDPGRPR